MTINSVSTIQSTPFVGLATQTYNVATTGIYTASVTCTIPYSTGTADNSAAATGSSLQLLIKLNSTTKLTLSSPTPTQASLSGSVQISATAGDTITLVPSSAAAVDNALNSVKGVFNVYLGQ